MPILMLKIRIMKHILIFNGAFMVKVFLFHITPALKVMQQLFMKETPLFWDGATNTKEIAAKQENNLQYAASVAYAFYPLDIAQEDSRLGAGKWYLPSLGEWMEIEGYDYNLVQNCDAARDGRLGTKREIVNTTLATLASKGVKSQEAGGYYWSSSAHESYNSWKYSLGQGYRTTARNTDQLHIRVCFEF